jgi:hypothetical protein
MTDIPASLDWSKQFCDVQEYSDVTGLSPATVRRYLRTGKIPFAQPGGPRGRILIPIAAVSGLTPKSSCRESERGGEDSSSLSSSLILKDDIPVERLAGPMPRWALKVNGARK